MEALVCHTSPPYLASWHFLYIPAAGYVINTCRCTFVLYDLSMHLIIESVEVGVSRLCGQTLFLMLLHTREKVPCCYLLNDFLRTLAYAV